MRRSDKAWLVMLAGIVAYEASAGDGELLSQGWDRYITDERPWARAAAVVGPFMLAAHLVNRLPLWCDPIALGFLGIRRVVSLVRR